MGAEMIAKKFSTLTGFVDHPGDILNQAVDVVAYVRESILASMEADDATDGYSLKALGGMFYVLMSLEEALKNANDGFSETIKALEMEVDAAKSHSVCHKNLQADAGLTRQEYVKTRKACSRSIPMEGKCNA
jgi:hypothetical protein